MSHCSNHPIRLRQRGFTLAEILVTTAVFAIIMIAALAVYDQSNRTFKTSTEAADMQQSTRIGFEKLISDLRMAGFDYSRGGTPTNSYQVAQPDEQIEYAGSTAVVFRANFNYNTAIGNCGPIGQASAAPCNNGVEPALEPLNVSAQPIFPYVTTANNEIVAYVLHSATTNPSNIQFYVDDFQPRSVFPSAITPAPAGSNPSKKEALVTINGIDTTNANPPYTLYRVTLADGNCNGTCTITVGGVGTPVAENIRSINFKYYTDAAGATLLTGPPPTNAAITDGAIGGDGQYDPNVPGNAGAGSFADRIQRSLIQSVRVTLTGLNASPDLQGYTNPTETVTSVQKYRQYSLSSLIVPRNLGKTGFPEPTTDAPAPPQIVSLCTGHCGAPVIAWKAPTSGPPALQYKIQWDTDPNFTNPRQFTVSDPAATSTILPDDGIQDVSQLWYYRISTVNDNGQSAWSPTGISTWTARPKNATKPAAPSNLVATDTSKGTAQPNQITLTWNGPSMNDPSMNGLTCSGAGNGSATNIPNGEIIKFRLYRGTRADFDPRPGCSGPTCGGVAVLRLTSGSQPPPGVPGSQVTWVDNTLNEQLPQGGQAPAGCTQYYYRVQAVDRCVTNAAYEANGQVSSSESDFFPPINGSTNAIPGSALDTGTTPSAPVGLQVDTSLNASGCPDPVNGGVYCKITLQWSPVTTDVGGAAIGVDTYRITRKWKHQNNLPTNLYQLDTSFNGTGFMDVSGFSQQSPNGSGKISWVDTTAKVSESNPPFVGTAMSYEYTVAAKTCSKYSAESNFVDYPTPCTINPTIIQAGATNPTASGDTPATAWIMNAGDTITVTPPAGTTFSSVNFNVTTWPAGAPVDNKTVNTSPFVYTWSDRTDGQIYSVTITVTELTPNAGCQEIHLKYVQDQMPAACAFPNVTVLPALSQTTSGVNRTASLAFTVTNNGTDNLLFNTGSFQGQATESWTGPTVANPTLTATSFAWFTGANNQTDNYSFTTTPFTRSIPAAFNTAVAPSGTFTLTVRWQMKKTEPALVTAPLNKLCISYQIPSEPGVTKFCNLVGQSATTNNPASCD